MTNYEDIKRHRRVVVWHNATDWIPTQCPICRTPGGSLVRYSTQNAAFNDGTRDAWRCPTCGTMIERACKYIGNAPEEDR